MDLDARVAFFMVGEAARLTIAVIFALAAYHAMREWTVFGGIVEQYQMAPRRLAQIVAWILPPLEYLTAVCLVVPTTSRIGAMIGLSLMAVFTVAIGVNLARGRVLIDCGCGGASGQKLTGGLISAKGLVNNREQLESLLIAQEMGVASLQDYRAKKRDQAAADAE